MYKTTAMLNPKKKERTVIYQSLHEVLGRPQCHPAAAEGAKLSRMRRGNALLAVNGVSDHDNVVPTSYIAMQESCITKVMHNFLHIEPCMTKVIPGTP